MKKLILAMFLSAMCMATFAGGNDKKAGNDQKSEKKTDQEAWNKDFKAKKSSHKRPKDATGNLNNPGYHGRPCPKAPKMQANEVKNKKKDVNDRGENPNLGYLR